jgi:DNA polymerase V
MEKQRTYICIDLKSFYASVECIERKLDPLTTNLVVADASRTEKTICLAVSPSLKAYGLKGRSRLFEVVEKVRQINLERKRNCPYKNFIGESIDSQVLRKSPELKLAYVIATPQMRRYIEASTKIYSIYLKYVAKEDIHVYSIDEVFMDVTCYLHKYHNSAHEMALLMIKDVLKETGITATAGIGTNLYLAKVAMDIVAKHVPADRDGVRIAALDEMSYREKLWNHTPLTDFWRVGKGYVKRLSELGLYTMGDIAKCSILHTREYNEDILYSEFGVNAELLIDHAWGYEPCTIPDIKNYKPSTNSISEGQVIHCPYDYIQTKVLLNEMIDDLSLSLVEKNLVTDMIGLTIIYDTSNLEKGYQGQIKKDYLGRNMPKPFSGRIRLDHYTSSDRELRNALLSLYERNVNQDLLIRKLNISFGNLMREEEIKDTEHSYQTSLFEDSERVLEKKKMEKEERIKDKKIQEAVLSIKKKYGKNSILKANDFTKDATGRDRNNQIGGHKA